MRLKYRFYTVCCYLAILLTSAMFLEFVYEVGNPFESLDEFPFWRLFLVLLFFGLYVAHPLMGLSLLSSLAQKQDITRAKLSWFRVIFFVQIAYQLLIFYLSADTFQMLSRMIENGGRWSFFDYRSLAMEIVAILLALCTACLELLGFSIVKAVRKNYVEFLEEIDQIGETDRDGFKTHR
jgi:hypothetical protein